ncbi:MAG: serine/threonine-protein kinase, partial [Planctomycetia bacterium]
MNRLLGRGGQGAVYLAFDERLNREVAVKLLSFPSVDADADRLLREAKVAGGLRHRNIVRVLDAVVATEGVAIVMEVVRGPSLAQWLKDAGGKAPVRLGAEIVRRAAEAVGEAHRSKLLHRDVKPGNILLEPISAGEPTLDEAALLDETVGPARFGVVDEFDADFPYEPLLADFGLARPVEIDGETLSAMVGTPKYMAPEQLDPDRAKPLTYAVDVYALGMVLYVLVAGKPP